MLFVSIGLFLCAWCTYRLSAQDIKSKLRIIRVKEVRIPSSNIDGFIEYTVKEPDPNFIGYAVKVIIIEQSGRTHVLFHDKTIKCFNTFISYTTDTTTLSMEKYNLNELLELVLSAH